jgi:hypothetical protein
VTPNPKVDSEVVVSVIAETDSSEGLDGYPVNPRARLRVLKLRKTWHKRRLEGGKCDSSVTGLPALSSDAKEEQESSPSSDAEVFDRS